MIKKLLLLNLLFPFIIWSQNDSIIKGKVVSEIKDLEGIHVINLTKISGAVTDSDGYFYIQAKALDTLMFSAVFLERKKYILKPEDISNKLVLIPIAPSTEYLKEVVVTEYPNINAVALGIISKNQRSYTPAERKLLAAGDFKWYSPLLIPLGGMSVDGLINQISGRKSMLKKELIVERKELLQQKTMDYFDADYFIKTLHIPQEYVDGFVFYIADNVLFSNAMKNKNKTQATFVLSQLAVEFLNLKEIPLHVEDRYTEKKIEEALIEEKSEN